MLASLAIASLLSAAAANAVPCVQFDASWNLYAFGGDSDVKIGDNTTWSSPSTTTLTTSGRPPWTGNNTQCILSQTNNAMVVLGADSSDLSSVYIYDFSGDSWSTQTTSSAPSDIGNSRSSSVYDHDTSVIYTLTTGSGLYQLDLSSVTTSASSDAVAWEAVENSSFSVDGYTVTAAAAANHIFYFGVPDTAAGSANVFVVHYAYFQPDAQAFNGTAFPDTAGQAISVPSSSNDVPYSMVFIPNDFSNTYIATHWTNLGDYSSMDDVPFSTDLINSTQTLAAPTSQDETASYAASPGAIVQINAAGEIYYLSNPINSDYTVSSSASWSKLDYTLSGTGGTVSSSSNSSSSSASASGSGSESASSSATGSAASGSSSASASASSSSSSSSGALQGIVPGNLAGLALGAVALGAGLLM
ncbi:hypothetical protein L202_02885 [Cryptococcus amylolentus CBS 6039]|uniref:DOMON domain-containing protein n=2 Tax=Cryptococcus amylolentus TaxID=104669 RepID=A0A1E3HWL4_9TREE|nr:hypothetical protein L202_02885 [Cryptococcus amylolentus CBS 6039]ODN80723.1 hypothetical protein L202_02885 [Cryptococcus amylolentus CBS 6039]ODO09260.1 hypothetical protein I350_02860 [Cryptococcus amylolentus CBS 6273]